MNKDGVQEKVAPNLNKKTKINKWKIASFVLGILLVISLFSGNGLSFVSGNAVAVNAVDFINSNILQGQGTTATLQEVKTENGLVKAMIDIGGQVLPIYISKDGKLLFLQAIPLSTEVANQNTNAEQQNSPQPVQEVTTKSDKPEVELFVMSHCPYGTQMEKAMLPVVKTLGDKVDFNVKFVYYAMHGEKEVKEELNQYCIQKEQNDKYLDYLYCFLEDGDGERCLDEVGIDKEKLTSCTEAADKEFKVTEEFENKDNWLSGRFPLFNIYKADNEKYGVRGSPTLVINGETVSVSRDSASLLKVICSAFNEQPEECNQEFSSAQLSPGFGFSESAQANNAAAGCGV